MPSKKHKRLTPLETQIMNALWKLSKASVREVQEQLKNEKAMAYNTVLTMMRILRDKGFVESQRKGRTDIYRPVLSRKQIGRSYLDEMLQTFFSGSASALVSQLLESKKMNPDEVTAIRELINKNCTEEKSKK